MKSETLIKFEKKTDQNENRTHIAGVAGPNNTTKPWGHTKLSKISLL